MQNFEVVEKATSIPAGIADAVAEFIAKIANKLNEIINNIRDFFLALMGRIEMRPLCF